MVHLMRPWWPGGVFLGWQVATSPSFPFGLCMQPASQCNLLPCCSKVWCFSFRESSAASAPALGAVIHEPLVFSPHRKTIIACENPAIFMHVAHAVQSFPPDRAGWACLFGNISGANQFFRANYEYENFNLDYHINIQGEGAERREREFAKVWLHNPRAGPDCKITQSPIPLRCWSNDSDWSFHSLHEEVGLHLIHCLLVCSEVTIIIPTS